MTNSMIPYSFIPGTKAKATEVNANFASLANCIEQYNTTANSNLQTEIQNLSEDTTQKLALKADKTDLKTEFTIDEENTDLDDYKTKGTYIFTSDYKPLNTPTDDAGMLIVTGDENSVIKQIWFSTASNPAIYTRDFENLVWGDWASSNGQTKLAKAGYIYFPNGVLLQWGQAAGSSVTYPLAFKSLACPVFSKQGYDYNLPRSDTGFSGMSLTGFTMATAGAYSFINWISIGY